MTQIPIPISDGVDMSYPTNFKRSADNFYCIEPGQQPWITALDDEGRGLVQTSTPRLRGRKLFVWGMGSGGRHWQEFFRVLCVLLLHGIDPGNTGAVLRNLRPPRPRSCWYGRTLLRSMSFRSASLREGALRNAVRRKCPRCRSKVQVWEVLVHWPQPVGTSRPGLSSSF